jgi:KDO2-lipid IV(A) lauroyltransferase
MSDEPAKNTYFTETTDNRRLSILQKIRHAIEVFLGYVFIHVPYRYCGRGYVKIISFLIGIVGPLSFAHRRVIDNLNLALPDMSPCEKRLLAKNSWKNIAYIPYDFITAKYNPQNLNISVEGLQHLETLKAQNRHALFFSGHNACWEIFRIIAHKHGINSAIIYRAFNNRYFDSYARNLMNHGFAPIFQKNPLGIKKMLKYLRDPNTETGGHILMLNDQRLSKGISVPFFNTNALTAPSAAELALRYDLALIPIFVTRSDMRTYNVIIHPEIDIQKIDAPVDKKINIILTKMNKMIENHIRLYPHEWFWLHRRWR